MPSLVDRIRAARENRVEAGGFTFTVRRPTDLEAARLTGASTADLLRYVIGWQGVRELDLVPGGDAAEVAFSPEVAQEWLADRPDLWGPLTEAVVQAYQRHTASLEDAEKN